MQNKRTKKKDRKWILTARLIPFHQTSKPIVQSIRFIIQFIQKWWGWWPRGTSACRGSREWRCARRRGRCCRRAGTSERSFSNSVRLSSESIFMHMSGTKKQVDNLSKMHSPCSQRLHVRYASQAINPFYTSHQSNHSRQTPPRHHSQFMRSRRPGFISKIVYNQLMWLLLHWSWLERRRDGIQERGNESSSGMSGDIQRDVRG